MSGQAQAFSFWSSSPMSKMASSEKRSWSLAVCSLASRAAEEPRAGPGAGAYSIRYMPADARFFDIGDYEAATREKGLTDGAPLAHAGEYYPQVWPRPIRGERWRVRLGLLKQDGFTKPPPVPSS